MATLSSSSSAASSNASKAKAARKSPARPPAVKSPAAKKVAAKLAAKSAPAKPGLPAAKPAAAPAAAKPSGKVRVKLVRDSFTMPEADFALVGDLKKRALGFQRPAKKSELLRAGLHALQSLGDPALKAALDALTPLKAGRPKKGD